MSALLELRTTVVFSFPFSSGCSFTSSTYLCSSLSFPRYNIVVYYTNFFSTHLHSSATVAELDVDERVDDWQRSSLNSDEDPPHMRTVMAIQINEAIVSLPLDEQKNEEKASPCPPCFTSVAVIQLTGITYHMHEPLKI